MKVFVGIERLSQMSAKVRFCGRMGSRRKAMNG